MVRRKGRLTWPLKDALAAVGIMSPYLVMVAMVIWGVVSVSC